MRNNSSLSAIQILGFFILIANSSCDQRTAKDLTNENIIPQPLAVTATNSSFVLDQNTKIFIGQNENLRFNADFLKQKINETVGLELSVVESETESSYPIIMLSTSSEIEINDEGYQLDIAEDIIVLSAKRNKGVFYGIQTLLQMLPPTPTSKIEVATGTITDSPEYGYRGSMLDVARHYFDKNDIKRYIDFLAFYKMNVLHLHLTDDQGWRIEIKSWPKLAEYGGLTEVGGGKGGFITQNDYVEIVKYASDRHILIIPEIDMPGHTQAALAAYPELSCDGQARMVAAVEEMSTEYPGLYTGTEVGFSTLCTGQETTYKIINDVIEELASITPGPYIHIGGDESHSTEKEDYIMFMERAQAMVKAHGKKSIGWDEIAQTDVEDGTIVQFWASEENTRAAIEKGAQLLMSPAKKAYLDMQYDSTTRIGLHWAAYIEVDEGYNWDPATYMSEVPRENIIGIEAPLWTETTEDMDDLEYLAFPRLPGYAEIGWTPNSLRNWEEYKYRLAAHGKRFTAMNIDYYRSDRVPWEEN